MSHQPSTLDTVRSKASSATQAVAASLDPGQNEGGVKEKIDVKLDSQGAPCKKGSFKDQLNEAAYADGGLENRETKKEESYLEKALSYIPGMSATKNTTEQNQNGTQDKAIEDSGVTPKRPENDLQVEEFLKEQYKSKSGADMPNVGEAS